MALAAPRTDRVAGGHIVGPRWQQEHRRVNVEPVVVACESRGRLRRQRWDQIGCPVGWRADPWGQIGCPVGWRADPWGQIGCPVGGGLTPGVR